MKPAKNRSMSGKITVLKRRILRFGGSALKSNKTPNFAEEKRFARLGFVNIAGVDEVGRGSIAGPVVAAAVILPANFKIPQGFGDSKQVKPQKRKVFAKLIKRQAKTYFEAVVPVSKIDKLGLGKAVQIAFRKALKSLAPPADFILIDAFYISHLNRKNQRPIVRGDQKSASIAAASILAKVYRDKIMKKLARKYPEYKFGKNKGYGTKDHQVAIKKFGLSKIHRKSFNLNFLNA